MILSRQHFDLGNKRIIEKLIIRTPFRFEAIFQEGACFLHFKNDKSILSLPTNKIEIENLDSVVLNCDYFFIDFVQNVSIGSIEVYAIHLYPDLLMDIYKDAMPLLMNPQPYGSTYVKKVASRDVINHFIDSLIFYFENPALVNTELLILKLKELILLLLQTDNSTTLAELMNDLFSPRTINLKEVIRNHQFSNFSVKEIANLAGLSLSSFKREFQRIYNETPANYIRSKKIEKAIDLLKVSNLSISEICYQLGFNDVAHFTNTFKKKTGQSPSVFRTNNKSPE